MINCILGGPDFLAKMIPVTKLNADFLNDQIEELMKAISEAGVNVVALICDNNRINRHFSNVFNG